MNFVSFTIIGLGGARLRWEFPIYQIGRKVCTAEGNVAARLGIPPDRFHRPRSFGHLPLEQHNPKTATRYPSGGDGGFYVNLAISLVLFLLIYLSEQLIRCPQILRQGDKMPGTTTMPAEKLGSR